MDGKLVAMIVWCAGALAATGCAFWVLIRLVAARQQRRAARQPGDVPPRDPFKAALRSILGYKMTEAEEEAQRRSFVYGNVKLSNRAVTRDMVDAAADELRLRDSTKDEACMDEPAHELDGLKEKEALRLAAELDSVAGKLRSIAWENRSPGRVLDSSQELVGPHRAAYDKGFEDCWAEFGARNDATKAVEQERLPAGLRWTYEPECWQLRRGDDGSSSATVCANGTWHTWDTEGVGGENSREETCAEARAQALGSVISQGFAAVGVSEADAYIDDLEEEVSSLEAEVEDLQAELEELKKMTGPVASLKDQELDDESDECTGPGCAMPAGCWRCNPSGFPDLCPACGCAEHYCLVGDGPTADGQGEGQAFVCEHCEGDRPPCTT